MQSPILPSPAGTDEPPRAALFALGFRPFFLLAGWYAVASMVVWLWLLRDSMAPANRLATNLWHVHEMLMGYTVAVMAGFLLTAVRNWTNRMTLAGAPLALLAGLWLLGRLLPYFEGTLPQAIIAGTDLVFLPLLAAAIAVPVIQAGHYRSLMFAALLLLLFGANLLLQGGALGMSRAAVAAGVPVAVYIVVLMIVIMGGRVIPFFTERALPGVAARRFRLIEILSWVSVLLLLWAELGRAPPVIAALAAWAAAAVHGIRLAGWTHRRIWSVPLLWVLHTAYGWLVIGFFLKGAAAWGWLAPNLATHALTAGGIGVMTLGMMSRVSLGHTGRPLQVPPTMTVAFALVNLAALTRVFPPLVSPEHYLTWIRISAGLWIAAFALFSWIYTPILIKPRADGRPG